MTAGAPLSRETLASMELFQGLPASALEGIAAARLLRRLPKDMRVFSQGDDGVRAHVVIAGGVRISQTGSDGAEVVVRFIGPGEMFGTVSLFTNGRYPADAVAVVDTLEVSWSEAELLALIDGHAQIAVNVIRIIGKRLQEAQERVRELATQRAEQRVARALLRLAHQTRCGPIDGTAITFPLRRKDVADIAGTTLHTASRILNAWEKAGFLATRAQRLIIRQSSEILRIAEDTAD